MGFVFCDNYYSRDALCIRFTLVITNLKFQHKPKYISFFKNPHIKNRPMIIIITKGPKKIP